MDKEYLEKHDIVNRYVLDQLTEKEQVEFELYFMSNPDIIDDIEIARALKEGLTSRQDELEISRISSSQSHLKLFQIVGNWFQIPAVQLGNFALLAALVGIVTITPRPEDTDVSAGSRVWIGEIRGSSQVQEIEINTPSLVFDIDVERSGTYEVRIVDAQGNPISKISGIESKSDALLIVYDSRIFRGSALTLVVSAANGDVVVQRELKISRPEIDG